MNLKLILFASLCISLSAKTQSIFSTLHLNEEREVRKGVPKSISTTTIFYTSSGEQKRTELIEYDHLGLPVSKKLFDENNEMTSVTSYKYDTINRVLLQSRLDEYKVRYPTQLVLTVYKYEGARSPVRIQYQDLMGKVASEAILKNNELGLPIQLELYQPVGKLLGIELATYIPEENKAIVSVANSNGEILTTDTTKISFKDAYKFAENGTKYNDKGDVIYSESKWPNGSIHYSEYEYTYDNNDNWTEEKSFDVSYKSNGKKKRIVKSHVTRQIVYW